MVSLEDLTKNKKLGSSNVIMLFCFVFFINFIFLVVPSLSPNLNLIYYLPDWIYINILLLTGLISSFYYKN